MAANPLGATPLDTGEFLLGTVAVTPVLLASDGTGDTQTQSWSAEEIDQVLARVSDGVNWWSDTLETLNTVHSLEFVIDETFARNPVETRYEPIDRKSSDFNLYVGDFITAQGFGDANSIEEGVGRFNDQQRSRLGTDWAFTIFIVDASDDADGLFASGNSFAAAFAYAGGLFLVTPSTRPASTIAHEMGHIFWARDEYSDGGSWSDRRGYYDTQNLNAADNPTPGFKQEISIMRGGVPLTAAYEANVSPASTLAMVGWQDSDGDGVFDLADVPLQFEGSAYFDSATSLYRLQGSASAVPLMNRNSSGLRSDITLNRISQLQYRLDEGPWLVAAQPNQQTATFDLSVSINTPFSTIQWRVIDLATGITSPVMEGTPTVPALSDASMSGLAFVDVNGDGIRNLNEAALAGTLVIVTNADGSPPPQGEVDAGSFADGEIPSLADGVVIAASGLLHGVNVGSFESEAAGGARVFHAFNQQRDRWVDRWTDKVSFTASFNPAVGEVEVDVIGIGDSSFARVEAYDAGGTLLTRTTSDALAPGETTQVRVSDSLGRIASVRVFGHAGSSVAIERLQFGSLDRVTTDESGAWRITNLPNGSYQIHLQPQRTIHQFVSTTQAVEVLNGESPMVLAGASRVDSIRHNSSLAEDVNGDGDVSAGDALVVINDISRFQPRVLNANDPTQYDVDVNNDGAVSAIDALMVINLLGRSSGGGGPDPEGVPSGGMAGLSANLNGEPGVEPILPLMSQMVDSAGSASGVESIDDQTADSSEQQADWRQSARVSKIVGFFEADARIGQKITTLEGPRPSVTIDSDGFSHLILTELTEPFDVEMI